MNVTTELQKYFNKDIAEVITEYTDDSCDFYRVNKYVSWSSANTFYQPYNMPWYNLRRFTILHMP